MSKRRILIVEDELIVAKDLQKTLEAQGYEVVGKAASGPEALEKASNLNPDLILMDIILKGGTDGIETAREIQKLRDVPVIFLTAYGDQETLERVKAVNPFGYILKPYEERELQTAIEVALVRHNLETKLDQTVSLLEATLESTADGLLVVDRKGRITLHNRKFAELWSVPEEVLALGNDDQVLALVLNQLKEPDVFLKKVYLLYDQPEENSFDVLEFKDGRFFERYSQPQRLGNEIIGRVWSFRDVTQRKNAAADLLASEERFYTLAETAPAGIYLSTPEGACQYVNQAWCEMTGIPLEKALGRDWVKAIHPDDRESLAASWKKAIREKESWEREYRFLDPEGKVTWVFGKAAAIQDASGDLVGYVGINMDITERVRLENSLQESEQLYRNLVENSLNAIFLRNEHQFLFFNDQFCQLVGYTRPELESIDPLDIIAPEHREAGRQAVGRRLAGDPTPAEYETRILRKDGSFRDVIIRATLVNYLGQPAIQGNFFDITLRKESESALRESERRLRRFYNDFPLAYQSLDEDGRFLEVNPIWLMMLGREREEVIGHWFGEFLAPGTVDHFLKNFPCFKDLGVIQGIEFEMVKKDGSSITVSFNGKIDRDEQGRFRQTHCVLQDISDRLRLEKQLRQAQKMESIGTLAGGIAHDFNNILGAIMGYTEVALMDSREDDPIRESLEQVRKATFRARDLIKQILAFSRQGEQELKAVQLGLIVKEALKLLRATIPSTIEIRRQFKENHAWIMGDPTQVHQVLMNLCTNALQAMEGRQGLLEVSIEKIELDAGFAAQYPGLVPGPHLRLTVGDSGSGIDPRIIDRIFDPFFTTKGLGEGTGMGLSVVHGIIKNHGGLITVYSEKGAGTTFQIYFPAIRQDEQGREIPEGTALKGGKERILFVDDEEFLINVGKQMLERLGYRVTTRSNGPEALELFRDQPDRFDLVITDQTMPRMTGLELAREMIAVRRDLPIVLCTGFSEGLTAERTRDLGIRDFIMKPVVLHDLARTIRRALNNTDTG
jgi:PAS domain S-box-containing protein